jgi:hypothetical protein
LIPDNQLELVFAGGKAIIPPLILERERIWSPINSIRAQIRDDGQVRVMPPVVNNSRTPAFEEIVNLMGDLQAQHDRNG